MDLSLFLAKAVGLYLVIAGIGVLGNIKTYARIVHDYTKSEPLIVLGAGIDLLVGILIVTSHNVWASDWRVVITIVGWLSIVSGLSLLCPKAAAHWMRKWIHENTLLVFGIIFTILGVFLVYQGFVA